MNRYRATYPRDDASSAEGDTAFMGVNSKLSPEKLPPGMVREAINKEFRSGKAATRKGMRSCRQLNPNWPFGQQGYGAVGNFTDGAGDEWLLIAAGTGIRQIRWGRKFRLFQHLPGNTGNFFGTEFVQVADRVIMFRGPNLTPWQWDGTPTGTWVAIDQRDPMDSTLPIPNASTAEVIANRLAIPTGLDSILFTKILDPIHYDPALEQFAVNEGTEDRLVRIFPFAGTSVLCFKRHSVYLMQNVEGDLSSLTLTEVTRALGCVAQRAVCLVGADVFFLSSTGVYQVSQIVQDRIQTQPTAVSAPIEPFFRSRVNWAAIAGACAMVLGEVYYLALPIDGSTFNNVILIYRIATGQWEGWWTMPGRAAATFLVRVEVNGQARLAIADSQTGQIFLTGEGYTDIAGVATGKVPIADSLLTRGYQIGDEGFKAFTRCEIVQETWNPSFTHSAETESSSRTLATSQTKSRTAYYQFGRPPWAPDNSNDDHQAQGRQDYSIDPSTALQIRSGLAPDLVVQASERRPFGAGFKGRWVSLRLTNAGGRCDIVSCQVEARQVDRTTRTRP